MSNNSNSSGNRSDFSKIVSWALYDWGNSAFATTVMAGFFPIFFKKYWSVGSDMSTSTAQLGIANSIASVVVAILAPLLGAISDKGSAKKKFLLFFTMMGIVMTGSLFFVEQGNWALAIILYAVASIGFAGGNIFYDALIVFVARDEKLDFVSALGFSLGYLGGGILFAQNVWMTLKPEVFGLSSAQEAIRISFILVASWWALFSIPIFLFVPEKRQKREKSYFQITTEGFREILDTFSEIRKYRVTFLFLISYWVYIDGVDTIIKMAVDYGIALGFETNSLIVALLITQFVGFPSALAFGYIGKYIGAKNGILIGIFSYACITIYAYFMDSVTEFYALAIGVGLVQGGVQSLSRSLYARLIPPSKSGEFFGLYNMLGKFAAVLGPLTVALVSYFTKNPRLSILSIILFFIVGGILLSLVDIKAGHKAIEEIE